MSVRLLHAWQEVWSPVAQQIQCSAVFANKLTWDPPLAAGEAVDVTCRASGAADALMPC